MAHPHPLSAVMDNLELALKLEYNGLKHTTAQLNHILKERIPPEGRTYVNTIRLMTGRHLSLVSFTTPSYCLHYKHALYPMFEVHSTVLPKDIRAFERAVKDSESDEDFRNFLEKDEENEAGLGEAPVTDDEPIVAEDRLLLAIAPISPTQPSSTLPSSTPSTSMSPFGSPSSSLSSPSYAFTTGTLDTTQVHNYIGRKRPRDDESDAATEAHPDAIDSTAVSSVSASEDFMLIEATPSTTDSATFQTNTSAIPQFVADIPITSRIGVKRPLDDYRGMPSRPVKRVKVSGNGGLSELADLCDRLAAIEHEDAPWLTWLYDKKKDLLSTKNQVQWFYDNATELFPCPRVCQYARAIILNDSPDESRYENLDRENGYPEDRKCPHHQFGHLTLVVEMSLDELLSFDIKTLLESQVLGAEWERSLIVKEVDEISLLKKPWEDLVLKLQNLMQNPESISLVDLPTSVADLMRSPS